MQVKNESGRSMVEMLGVLAIIGVLSIIGISGYKTAMAKIKANEAVNAANQEYVNLTIKNGGACSSTSASVTLTEPSMVKDYTVTVTCPSTGTASVIINPSGDNAVKTAIGNMANANNNPYIYAQP